MAAASGSDNRCTWSDKGVERSIPNANGGVRGTETAPNRRGSELAGLVPVNGGWSADDLVRGDHAAGCSVLIVADADPGSTLHAPQVVDRLRDADLLVVLGWAETPLTRAADIVLPLASHVERDGTFVNSQWRLQPFERAFPATGEARAGVEIFLDLLARFSPDWKGLSMSQVFARMAASIDGMEELSYDSLPATGVPLSIEGRE